MFGKSGFILRALFATALVSSLVACTFEQVPDETQGQTNQSSTAADKNRKGTNTTLTATNDAAAEENEDVDAGSGPDDPDGSIDEDADVDGGSSSDGDSSSPHDGGPHVDSGGGAIDAGPAPSNDW